MRSLFESLLPETGYETIYANHVQERKGILTNTKLYFNYVLGYREGDFRLALLQIDAAMNAVGRPAVIERERIARAKIALSKEYLIETPELSVTFSVPPFVTPVAGVLFYPVRQEAEAKRFKAFFKRHFVSD
jgi:hypothetical protein